MFNDPKSISVHQSMIFCIKARCHVNINIYIKNVINVVPEPLQNSTTIIKEQYDG